MRCIAIVLVAALAVSSASHIHGHTAALLHGGAEVLEGPSSRTTVVGPEGSVITAVAPGGKIVTEEHVGGIGIGHTEAVVAAAPLVAHGYAGALGHSGIVSHGNLVSHAGYLSHAAPVVAHTAPIVAHHGSVAAYASPVVAHSAQVVAHPASVVAHSAPYVAHSAPVVAGVWGHSAPVVAHSAAVVAAGQPLDSEAVVSGPSGVVTRAGAVHGVAHAAAPYTLSHHGVVAPYTVSHHGVVAPYTVSHYGVVTADTHGDVVVSGPSGRITASGVVPGVLDHHVAHELAYENLEAW